MLSNKHRGVTKRRKNYIPTVFNDLNGHYELHTINDISLNDYVPVAALGRLRKSVIHEMRLSERLLCNQKRTFQVYSGTLL